MKSILKRRDDTTSDRRRSTSTQPQTAPGYVVAINAEDVCLSKVPCSASRWPRSSCVSPVTVHDVDVVGRPRVDRLQREHVTELERHLDADLQRVEEKLERIERHLDSQFQPYERSLRSPIVEDLQVGLPYRL